MHSRGLISAFIQYSQISVIRTPIIRNYWVIRRRWTVPTFFSIIYCNKTTNYLNFDHPKNSIFRSDSSVLIEEVAIKLPFKIWSPKVQIVIIISLFGRDRFTHLSELANNVATGNWHRINVHTITWWTVKWVNGVSAMMVCLMFFKCLIRGINELKLILIWSSRILWFILDQCTLSEHTKRTDFVQQK